MRLRWADQGQMKTQKSNLGCRVDLGAVGPMPGGGHSPRACSHRFAGNARHGVLFLRVWGAVGMEFKTYTSSEVEYGRTYMTAELSTSPLPPLLPPFLL